jgi:hypothetical protein
VNGLDGVDQGPLDGLLDPPGGVGGEANIEFRVEAFDGLEQADVSFFDLVLEGESAIGVIFGDVDDESEVGADHFLTCRGIIFPDDAARKFLLPIRA